MAMTFNRNAGGHAFDERGGKCKKCGMLTKDYLDTDSKDYHRPCQGDPEKREPPMTIDETFDEE